MISFATALAYAQATDIPKLEIGTQFALTRLRDLQETDPGMGLRVTYNLTNSIAAEAEFNYFGKNLSITVPTGAGTGTTDLNYSQSRTQGLLGVKYTFLRGDKFGIGGKLRPGFMRFNGSGQGGIDAFLPNGQLSGNPISQIAGGYTSFAMDIGGVLEYYPSQKTIVRFDLGDTIIRLKGIFASNDGGVQNGRYSNNLQLNVGFGFRF
jgi:Outer membrane protein beta-barrel domain